VIITDYNYNKYELNIIIDSRFKQGNYQIRVQTCGSNKYFGKSNQYINIDSNKLVGKIIPNIGYNNISYISHPKYKISNINNKIIITPDGVTKIDFNINYNNDNYSGKIRIKQNSRILIRSDDGLQLLINNESIILKGSNELLNIILRDRIEDFKIMNNNGDNSVIINYICENGYIVKLTDEITDEFLHVYIANNSNGQNLEYYKMVHVLKDDYIGSYFKLNNKKHFNLNGRIHFYINKRMYIGYIDIIYYPIECSLILDTSININEIINCKIEINNSTNIEYDVTNIEYNVSNIEYDVSNIEFDVYFVNDLYGNSPYYLTRGINNNGIIDISFIYSNYERDKIQYIMICSKNSNNIINKIINVPITIQSPILMEGQDNYNMYVDEIIKSEITTKKESKINYTTTEIKDIIGVYTTFDTPPNKTTPSNFLETFGLYTY
jgi:hypothetical protein